MSEKQSAKKLSHLHFYKAVQALKKNRAEFLSARPSVDEAARMLSAMTGLSIGGASVASIKEAAGIKWVAKKDYINQKGSDSSIKNNAIQTLTRAVALLYKSLGVDMNPGMQNLYDFINHQSNKDTEGQGNGNGSDQQTDESVE